MAALRSHPSQAQPEVPSAGRPRPLPSGGACSCCGRRASWLRHWRRHRAVRRPCRQRSGRGPRPGSSRGRSSRPPGRGRQVACRSGHTGPRRPFVPSCGGRFRGLFAAHSAQWMRYVVSVLSGIGIAGVMRCASVVSGLQDGDGDLSPEPPAAAPPRPGSAPGLPAGRAARAKTASGRRRSTGGAVCREARQPVPVPTRNRPSSIAWFPMLSSAARVGIGLRMGYRLR